MLRKLPGSLGHADSAAEESFSPALEGGPEYPHYTRPADWRGWTVPDVLLSGHHEQIRRLAPRAEPSPRRGSATIGRRFRGGSTPADALLAMSTVIDSLERAQLRRVPRFQSGDRVKVHFQVVEGTRRRTQVFEGVVIKRQGEGVRETFTVRKQSFGVGVERTFPLHSPKIERIEVAARGDVRRAKLYYLRGRVGKRARVRERRYTGQAEEVVEAGLLHDPAAEAAAAADAEVPGEAVDAQALEEAPPSRTPPRRPPRAPMTPATEVKKGSSASGSLLELVLIVAVALGLALGIQAFLDQAVQDPVGVDGADARRSASACSSTASARASPTRTWATSSSSTRRPAPRWTTCAARSRRWARCA